MKYKPFEDIKLNLKKIYNKSVKKYFYRLVLCCPTIVELENKCPKSPLALKIPTCINIDGTLLSVIGCEIDLCYRNMEECHDRNPMALNDAYTLLFIKTSDTSLKNLIAIEKFEIPVKVLCMDRDRKTCAKLGDFSEFVHCDFDEKCDDDEGEECDAVKRFLVGIDEDGEPTFLPYVEYCNKNLIVEATENDWVFKDNDDCVECEN